jgi:hypothetical protein
MCKNGSPVGNEVSYSGACQEVVRRTTGAGIQQLEGSCHSDRTGLLEDVTRQLSVKTYRLEKI